MGIIVLAMAKAKQGEAAFKKIEKVNSELFSLTYGTIVAQLVKDCESMAEVNEQLEQMGYNIGTRIIDEFLAKSGVNRCKDFDDACETVAKVGFQMFLGVAGDVRNQSHGECSICLPDNPLIEFVELPAGNEELQYSNLLCGVIRGALEMVCIKVECRFVRDILHGDNESEIRVKLVEMLQDDFAPDDDD